MPRSRCHSALAGHEHCSGSNRSPCNAATTNGAVHRRPQNMPNSCMGTVAVWLSSAWRRVGGGVTRRCSSSRSLAACKAREAPPVMRFSTFLAWQRRWTRMIATSCGQAVAHSLVSSKGSTPGSDRIWPNLIWPSLFSRIWPIPHLANTTFGQSWPNLANFC